MNLNPTVTSFFTQFGIYEITHVVCSHSLYIFTVSFRVVPNTSF